MHLLLGTNPVIMVCKSFSRNLKQSYSNLTLHGVSNITSAKTIGETLFWILIFSLCFAVCLWLMIIHWLRYASRPTVTTIRTTAYPITNIPFPAVSICNSNIVYKKSSGVLQKQLLQKGVDNGTIQDFFKHLNYLIVPTKGDVKKYKKVYSALGKLSINTTSLMLKLMHPCDKMLADCHWFGKSYNCSEMFKPSKTGLGYCCTFKVNNDVKPSPTDDEYDELELSMSTGSSQGLHIAIDMELKEYTSKIFPFYATTILVHPRWDFADSSAFSISVRPGDFALMQISPTVYHSEESLREVSVEKRGCWFETEGYLQVSEDYSFKNCIVECKSMAIFQLCGCIPYYYPSSGERPQCTLMDVPCLKKHEMIYNNVQLEEDLWSNSTTCDCLPQCQDINYDGYINFVKDSMQNQFAVVEIFYQHAWCVEYMKSLNMTWDMLLASLGGIFGLCLGGSLISVVELISELWVAVFRTFGKNKPKLAPAKLTMITSNFYYPQAGP